MIIAALLDIAILLTLKFKGGLGPIFLYGLIEVFLATLYYTLVIFTLDTTNSCNTLGTSFCYNGKDPNTAWILLVIPGIFYDVVFLIYFRIPIDVKEKVKDV